MKPILIISIAFVILLTSCHYFGGERVHGNGHIKTESRTAGHFVAVDVSGSIDVFIKQDSVRSIRIEADENLLEFITVDTDGEKLFIHERDGYNLDPTRDIKVYVSSPLFKHLEASGACDIISENQINASENLGIGMSGSCGVQIDVRAPKVDADLSGACKIELKGQTKEFRVEGSGSTDIICKDLLAEDVSVGISGAGEAEVFASVKLNVQVSGSGDVRYRGNAAVTQDVSGAGTVKKMD